MGRLPLMMLGEVNDLLADSRRQSFPTHLFSYLYFVTILNTSWSCSPLMKTNTTSPTTFSRLSINYSYTHWLPHSFILRSDRIISCTSLVLIDIFVLFCSCSIDIRNVILCSCFLLLIKYSVNLIFDLISNLILIVVIVLLNVGLKSLLQMHLCLVRLCQLVGLIRLCVFGSLRLATAIMSYSNFCLISSLTLIVYVVRHPPAFSIHNIIFTSICTFYPISQSTRS